MPLVVRWLCAAALVFVLSAFIAGVVHACERWYDDGYTLWCCAEGVGTCIGAGLHESGVWT